MNRLDNFSKFQQLREEFEFFSYEGYAWQFAGDSLEIEFSYNLSGKYFFKPRIKIPYKDQIFKPADSLSPAVLDQLVFHAGMIELISYWKVACPKKVIIKPFSLSSSQVNFWKKLYYHGLGEFFYLNSIHATGSDFMEIDYQEVAQPLLIPDISSAGSLVPVGGGKDSAVTMGLINNSGLDWIPMAVNPGKTTRAVIATAHKTIDQTVEIIREIDPQLLKLNSEGFLNGHTPFSALLAFYSLLAAYLTDRNDILLSNESSASEVTVPGTSINHQYSKSLEFEKDFREYTRSFISTEFNYFSLLRPLSELQIAKLFAGMTGYHPHFRSCNVGSKTGSWCGHCPKCLFTFIILSPFLKPEQLTGIFGKNLLENESLAYILDELSGISEVKPFECIGTVEEVNLALDLAAGMYHDENLPALIRRHRQQKGINPLSKELFDEMLRHPGQDHFVPGKYMNLLASAIQ
jgi:hypothetical protein